MTAAKQRIPRNMARIEFLALREEIEALLAKGYDIGTADGMIGAKTRDAIKAEQTRLGQKADGRAGQKLLKAISAP